MINSMWSGVSGLRTHQTWMDVIGNDIANVNTLAFKQSNVSFLDSFYNSLGSPTSDTSGKQVGTGTNVGRVTQDFSGGSLRATGVPTHIGIAGDGYFVLKDASGQQTSYTRAGNFELSYNSSSGSLNLRGPDGKYLYGTSGGSGGSANSMISLPGDIQDVMISSKGSLSYIDGTGTLVEDAFTIDIATFPGDTGLAAIGGNQYKETAASGAPNFGAGSYELAQGYVENSNVDLAKEFTEMIVAERGFQANSRTITTSDSMLQELLSLKR